MATKKTTKTTAAKAKTAKAETAKAETAKAAEVKETAAPVAAVKETVAPAAAVEEKAAPAAKKTTSKKKAAATVYIQYLGAELTTDDIIAKAKDAAGIAEPKKIDVYVKPEENKVYYVIDGNEGSFFLV